tara:strand:+ start:118 stop:387 length:270 start_codon:yes stop_codon:yes gene_type:complete
MITANGLIQLGFVLEKDFILQDDGNGVYIRDWLSNKPQPTESEIEVAHVEWQSAYNAEQIAEQERLASAKSKLEALGLTTEEVKTAFGI